MAILRSEVLWKVLSRGHSPWTFWHLYPGYRREMRRAIRDARDDAALMIPDDTDPTPPPAIWELRSRKQELANRIALRWQLADEVAHTRYGAAVSGLQVARRSEQEAAVREQATRQRYEQVRSHAAEVHAQLNPPGERWYCSSALYYIAVAVLAVLDVPLTAMAFQTFGMDDLRTNLVAVLVVLLLAVMGHFVGHFLRKVRWGDGTVLLVSLLLISGCYIVGLGFAREQSITAVMLGEPVLNHFWDIWLFIAVTLMGLVVPALLARHERDEPLAGPVKAARKEWRRAHRAWAQAADDALWCARELRRATVGRQARYEAVRREIEVIGARAHVCMQAYVVTNMRNREGNRLPPGLQQHALPSVEMPPCLSAPLTWEPPLPVTEALLDAALHEERSDAR